MSNVDMSLDDLINKDTKGRGGRSAGGPIGRAPGGSRRRNAAPYARPTRGRRGDDDDTGHMGGSSVSDVAKSGNPVLKVKSDSKPNTVAGAICNVVREARGNKPPSVLATGPQAINQAIKAIAIARKYLLEEDSPIDITVVPKFEQDIREGSSVMFELAKARPIKRTPTEDDLTCKDKTDAFKLAGAMAQRVRDGGNVACTVKGPVPVLVAVKAIALAQTYVEDENIDIKFAVNIVDLENPELRGEVSSTYLHFALITK